MNGSRHPIANPVPHSVIPAKAGIQRGEGVRQPDDEKNRPTHYHFHSLVRPSQGHGDSGEGRNPEGRGWGNVVRSKTTRGEGLVPRWGRGGAWQNARCQFAVPSHNASFSYLGVPAPAGVSDCYESMSRTPIRDRPLRQPLIRHSRIPSSIRPLIRHWSKMPLRPRLARNPINLPYRHSGEGRNPEGVGPEGNVFGNCAPCPQLGRCRMAEGCGRANSA